MLTGLHLLTTESYRNERFNFIRNEEGLRRTAYLDQGIPHIGIGFNLRAANVQNQVFVAFGINPTDANLSDAARAREQQYKDELISVINGTYSSNSALQSALNDVMNRRANDLLLSAISDRRSTFEFRTDNEAIGVFNTAILTYETKLDTWLSGIPESKERIALVSLAYNTKDGSTSLLGNKLKAAINNDNRAEAWFEIRYNSNADRGHASRRYSEAAMFNLYDAGFNEEGAKEVMRITKQSAFSYQLSA